MDRTTTDKEIVRLFMQGMKYEAIGKALGMSKTQVGVRIWTLRMQGVELPKSPYGRKPAEKHVEDLNKLVKQLS